MAGTPAGGQKTRETIYKKYGTDFFVKIGAEGGRKGTTGGFYNNRELAQRAGRIGGTISRRGKANA